MLLIRQLSLWIREEGSALTSLAQAGVGALATGSVATQDACGATMGPLAASSIFLYEDGRAGFTGELEPYARPDAEAHRDHLGRALRLYGHARRTPPCGRQGSSLNQPSGGRPPS